MIIDHHTEMNILYNKFIQLRDMDKREKLSRFKRNKNFTFILR